MFRSYSARVEIALVRSRRTCGYRTLWFHFGILRFLQAISMEDGETESTARRGDIFRKHIGPAMFSAGSTLGLRVPDCTKEPLTLFIGFAAKYLFAKPCNNRYP